MQTEASMGDASAFMTQSPRRSQTSVASPMSVSVGGASQANLTAAGKTRPVCAAKQHNRVFYHAAAQIERPHGLKRG